jgi:RNAse (barnase) inhibitor barstar
MLQTDDFSELPETNDLERDAERIFALEERKVAALERIADAIEVTNEELLSLATIWHALGDISIALDRMNDLEEGV